MESRSPYYCTSIGSKLQAVEGIEKTALAAVPIVSAGDVTGAVVFIRKGEEAEITELQKSLVNAGAQFLSRQLEG